MTGVAVRQGTDEWFEARRVGVTSTDIPVILGVSAYGKSEGDLALQKTSGEERADEPEVARRKRLGKILEEAIRSEDEAEHGIKLRRVNRLLRHPEMPWALASLDFERVGERVIVEAKASRSGRFDELPQDVEAQVRWQLGVAGYPRAHVAVLRHGTTLECFDVDHDEQLFAGLVAIAEDFRDRLAAGGPFEETVESAKRRWPRDNGAEMLADTELVNLVADLIRARGQRKELETAEEAAEAAIKTRMGEMASLRGPGFRVTWKRTKDREETDWRSLADGLLSAIPETEREALVGIHTTARAGFRPFRVVLDKESES